MDEALSKTSCWNRSLALAVLTGTLLGLGFAVVEILANGYLSYGMWRLAIGRGLSHWNTGLAVMFVIWAVAFLFDLALGSRQRRALHRTTLRLGSKAAGALVALALLLNVGFLAIGCLHPPRGPNVILITVDTLRFDHLGIYGYSRNTSPNIDTFARDSLVFDNGYSHAPVTSSSTGSLLSGFLPHETGVFQNNALPLRVNTLAEFLKNRGYRTLAVVSNYVLRGSQNFRQGFDYYDDDMEEKEAVRELPERTAGPTTEAALRALERVGDNSFFLWVHYQDPHGPYTPPPHLANLFYEKRDGARTLPFSDTNSSDGSIPSYARLGAHNEYDYYVAQYDSEIYYFDQQFGVLIEKLKELELYNDALILVTADHGESMGEHDYYFVHENHLYDTLIHIPLFVRFGDSYRGRRHDYVQHIDVVPTVLELGDIETDLSWRGHNLLQDVPDSRVVFAETRRRDETYLYTILKEGWKLFYDASTSSYALFNLQTDPGEAQNLIDATENDEIKRSLAGSLHALRLQDLMPVAVERVVPSLSKEEKRKLQLLGYIE